MNTVTGQIALVEARRLLSHPLVIGAAVLMLALRTATTWTVLPIWRVVGHDTAYASCVLAGAALLAGHLAGGRDHRYGMTEIAQTLPARPRPRTLGLLAAASAVAPVAAVVVGAHLLSLASTGIVGPFDGWDLLASVALPVLAATAGIALARWLPGAMAGALGLFAAAMFPAITNFVISDPESRVPQVSPLLPNYSTVFDVPPRLTGWHLTYLLALTAAAAGVAVLRHRHRLLPAIVVGLSVAVAVTACVVKIRAQPDVTTEAQLAAFEAPAAYDCERHGGVTYCAFHGYRGLIAHWRSAVEPLVAAVPATGRNGLPPVRQIDNPHSIDPARPRAVLVPTQWGRWGSWAERSGADLSVRYAAGAVGLPADSALLVDGQWHQSCWGGGQPRTVIALWLAAQALPDGADRLRTRSLNVSPVHYGAAEADAAAALLARPRAEVTAALAPIWSRLTGPAAGDVLVALGLPALPPRPHPELVPCP